ASAPQPDPVWMRAIRVTQNTGRPTLVVITSRAHPQAARLLNELGQLPEAAPVRHNVQIVELPSEEYPDQLKRLGINRAPAVAVYTRSPKGGFRVWTESRSMDSRFILRWLNALSAALATTPGVDADVARTSTPPASKPGEPAQPTSAQ